MANRELIKLLCVFQIKQMELQSLEAEALIYNALFVKELLKLKKIRNKRKKRIWAKVNISNFNCFLLILFISKNIGKTINFLGKHCT